MWEEEEEEDDEVGGQSEQRNDILTAAVVPGKIHLLRIHPLIEGWGGGAFVEKLKGYFSSFEWVSFVYGISDNNSDAPGQ